MKLIPFGRGGLLSIVVAALVAALHGAPAPAPVQAPPPPLSSAVLAPALKAAAERDHVVLLHLDRAESRPLEGDATVAWIGSSDGKTTRQWLIQFRRSTATEREQSKGRKRDTTKYLSWGPVITFKSAVEALELWIAGPVVTSAPMDPTAIAPVKRVRVLVPADYLRLGLDDSVRVDEHIRRRVQAIVKDDPQFKVGHIYALEKPIKPENVARAKPVAEKIGYTPEMERAWAGGYVALQAFYDMANDVPELEGIAGVALDKPPVWKLAKLATGTNFMTSLGGPTVRAVDPQTLGLIPVATETFDAPYSFGFGKELIVSGRIVVSRPTPPFDTTAGVLALTAVHPKDMNRQVHVVIITGQRGGAAEVKSAKP